MARPTQCRQVAVIPNATLFTPHGIPIDDVPEVRLGLDELEALRLADMESMTAIEAADHMHVSRHTFGRILAQARKKTATALCKGQSLRIAGGHYSMANVLPAPAGFSGRLAVSALGPTMEAGISQHFGRAGGFVLIDVPSMEVSYLDSSQHQGKEEAGLACAHALADAHVSVVLGSFMGPKVYAALKACGIRIYLNAEGTVYQAVSSFCRGEMAKASSPNRD